ncbi:MAG: Mannitol dehydrogenase domain [Caulobacter sp.]|nr:Mannitol dehydrogenase domain [Caulobacter sp.]
MRLSQATLGHVRSGVDLPAYDRSKVTTGIVHFGPGAFHRAHQAVYVDDLLASDPGWGICEVSLHSESVAQALTPQDGLYTLAQLDAETRLRIVGSVRELAVAGRDDERIMLRLADPAVRLVSLTVTEKGYCLGPDGDLDFSHPDVIRDLAEPTRPASVIGWIAEGLARRRAAGVAAFTVLSCDNLTGNGHKLGRAVTALARRSDPALADWIEAEVRFPDSMVDSITPATDGALRERVRDAIGLEDAWPIQREAFTQWVIEDRLGPGAPDLASVGVILTDDVAAFERAKLRLLNGAHSTLAYLGLLRGHETVAQSMGDSDLERLLEALMTQEVLPTLTAPRGLDLPAYAADILARFRNPAIRHKLSQIAWDGSQKLPFRLLGTISDLLAMNRPIDRAALGVAAWMRFVVRQAKTGAPLVDPMAGRLADIGRSCSGDAAHDVAAFARIETIFPGALAADARFVAALERDYASL